MVNKTSSTFNKNQIYIVLIDQLKRKIQNNIK